MIMTIYVKLATPVNNNNFSTSSGIDNGITNNSSNNTVINLCNDNESINTMQNNNRMNQVMDTNPNINSDACLFTTNNGINNAFHQFAIPDKYLTKLDKRNESVTNHNKYKIDNNNNTSINNTNDHQNKNGENDVFINRNTINKVSDEVASYGNDDATKVSGPVVDKVINTVETFKQIIDDCSSFPYVNRSPNNNQQVNIDINHMKGNSENNAINNEAIDARENGNNNINTVESDFDNNHTNGDNNMISDPVRNTPTDIMLSSKNSASDENRDHKGVYNNIPAIGNNSSTTNSGNQNLYNQNSGNVDGNSTSNNGNIVLNPDTGNSIRNDILNPNQANYDNNNLNNNVNREQHNTKNGDNFIYSNTSTTLKDSILNNKVSSIMDTTTMPNNIRNQNYTTYYVGQYTTGSPDILEKNTAYPNQGNHDHTIQTNNLFINASNMNHVSYSNHNPYITPNNINVIMNNPYITHGCNLHNNNGNNYINQANSNQHKYDSGLSNPKFQQQNTNHYMDTDNTVPNLCVQAVNSTPLGQIATVTCATNNATDTSWHTGLTLLSNKKEHNTQKAIQSNANVSNTSDQSSTASIMSNGTPSLGQISQSSFAFGQTNLISNFDRTNDTAMDLDTRTSTAKNVPIMNPYNKTNISISRNNNDEIVASNAGNIRIDTTSGAPIPDKTFNQFNGSNISSNNNGQTAIMNGPSRQLQTINQVTNQGQGFSFSAQGGNAQNGMAGTSRQAETHSIKTTQIDTLVSQPIRAIDNSRSTLSSISTNGQDTTSTAKSNSRSNNGNEGIASQQTLEGSRSCNNGYNNGQVTGYGEETSNNNGNSGLGRQETTDGRRSINTGNAGI